MGVTFPLVSVLRLHFFSLLSLLSSELTAQKILQPSKIGAPDPKWLTKKVHKTDSSAIAVILFDYGKCISDPYWGTTLTIRRRIKIFKKEALEEWGNHILTVADSKLLEFSGTVYNLDEKNNITKTKLNLKDVFSHKDKRALNTKIFFPNLKEGSIIEYSYTIKTKNYTIFDWDFQHSIPVEWSEYEIYFPGGLFGTRAFIHGLYDLNISLKQDGIIRKYVLANIPAFKEEPFMPDPKLYRSAITFRLGLKKGFSEEYTKNHLLEHGITRDSAKMDTRIAAQTNFKIDLNGNLEGTIIIDRSGYEASLAREMINEVGEDEFLKSELEDKVWTVKNLAIENVDNNNLSLITRYELSIPDLSLVTDSLLFIDPFLALKEESNPFTLERRLYPVDLGSRIERVMTTTLTIPEGYTVDELPASGVLELPNNTAKFTISTSQLSDKIFVTSWLKINKVIYNVSEYPALREFFSLIIAKKSEQIVLRKLQSTE